MHRDFINNFIIKNFSIRTTGIEDNNMNLYHEKGTMHPNFYHYFDIWFWNFFAYFRKWFGFNVLFFQIALPFLLTVLSSMVFDVLKLVSPNSTRIRLLVLSLICPIIVPVSCMAMGQEYYLGFIFSAFNQAKFIYIGICMALVLYYYYTDGKYAFYLVSIALGLGFVNLIPAFGFFISIAFSVSLFRKEISFKDKHLYISALVLILSVSYVVYLYYPQVSSGKSYMSDTLRVEISSKEKLIRRLAIVRDLGIVLVLYLPYFIPLFFGLKKGTMNDFFKKHALVFTLLIGGGLGWLALHYVFFDSNQFFYNVFPFLMAFYLVFFYSQIQSRKTVYISCFLIVILATIINCQYGKITFNYKEHQGITKTELQSLKQFTKDKMPLKTAFLTFDARDTKHFTEYLIGDYYWYLVNNSPFVTVFLDDKNEAKIRKDYKQVNQIITAANNTPYGQMSQKHKNWTTSQKQIHFIKTKNISYLSVENGYPLAKEVKQLAKDSLQLPQAKIKIYKF